jgi:prepilin-type N-terminal cleavage/methylation domain-containing protein
MERPIHMPPWFARAVESALHGRVTRKRPPKETGLATDGFTLIEILIALGVLGVIMSAVYGSYRAVTGSMVALQPRIALDQKGRFFVQQFSRQIRCCYGGRMTQAGRVSTDQNDPREAVSGRDAAFFQGGRAVFNDDTMLRFVTTSSSLNRAADAGHLAVVSYRVDKHRQVLLTREEVYGRHTDSEDDSWRVVLENLREIEFEYFDGTDWRSEWDSNHSGQLPKAVQIKLTLDGEKDHTASFVSVVPIRCPGPRGRRLPGQGSSDADTSRSR